MYDEILTETIQSAIAARADFYTYLRHYSVRCTARATEYVRIGRLLLVESKDTRELYEYRLQAAECAADAYRNARTELVLRRKD